MGKFSDALGKGIDAQAQLEKCRDDLVAALREVGVDLSESSSLKVEVILKQATTFVGVAQTFMEQSLGYVPKKVEKASWQIVVKATGDSVPLADVEFSERGYPLTIRWPNTSARAHDGKGLDNALEELLSSRYAGERLREHFTAASPALPSTPAEDVE